MSELTKKEAYLAMYSFLKNDYSLSKSDGIACLLSSMSLLTPRYNTVIQDYKKFSYQRKLL